LQNGSNGGTRAETDRWVHVEWGLDGLRSRIDDTDVFVVVDVDAHHLM